MRILSGLFTLILNSKTIYRKSLLLIIDLFLIFLSYYVFFNLYRSNQSGLNINDYRMLIISTIIVAIPIYIFTGQYKSLTRYIASFSLYRMAIRNIFLFLVAVFLTYLFGFKILSLKSLILIWLVNNVSSGFIKISLSDILSEVFNKKKNKVKRVAIYGAGANGVELSQTISRSKSQILKMFIDDNQSLHGRYINEYPIYSPDLIYKYENEIDLILIAIPNLKKNKLNQIVQKMQNYRLPVIKIPSLEDITNGLVSIEELRPIPIEECLGRDPIPPMRELLHPGIKSKSVCVLGAGGSIGSELARQIIRLNPRRIVILEISEPSLYYINEELKSISNNCIEINSILGSAMDILLLKNIFRKFEVDVVFHAAAYKHVPLVENNPLQGISNNVISTLKVCEASIACGLSNMILISTDKAVRPSNVMGASKRFAELIVQNFAELQLIEKKRNPNKKTTCFSIVRFGNVLNSSGSVLPLFRKQIEAGGPITLTHENVERYFMTIPEAAELVLQTTVMSKGGEVFLLDMGTPIKIKDLAEKMIRSSGLTIKNDLNPEGDIEIKITGLRPGEKMYEELLIDAKSIKTEHPIIFKAIEKSLPRDFLFDKIKKLEEAISSFDIESAINILSEIVPEWERNL